MVFNIEMVKLNLEYFGWRGIEYNAFYKIKKYCSHLNLLNFELRKIYIFTLCTRILIVFHSNLGL